MSTIRIQAFFPQLFCSTSSNVQGKIKTPNTTQTLEGRSCKNQEILWNSTKGKLAGENTGSLKETRTILHALWRRCWLKFLKKGKISHKRFTLYIHMNKKRGGVLILFYFNAFNMYKIYLKYFTLKLANSLLLKKTPLSLCECTNTTDAAFWPIASYLKHLWGSIVHEMKYVRKEFPFLNIHPADSAQSQRCSLSL